MLELGQRFSTGDQCPLLQAATKPSLGEARTRPEFGFPRALLLDSKLTLILSTSQ